MSVRSGPHPLDGYTETCIIDGVEKERSDRKTKPKWNAYQIRALRQHLGLTQQEMASELGTRQQTISEWEVGMYQPRGASAKLLSMVAERAGFGYEAKSPEREGGIG